MKALLAVIQQVYVEGVSTRRVDDLIKSLGCDGISKHVLSLPKRTKFHAPAYREFERNGGNWAQLGGAASSVGQVRWGPVVTPACWEARYARWTAGPSSG